MDIRIATGKPPKVTLTVTEERGLRSSLEIAEAVRDHLEPPFDLSDDEGLPEGSAGLLLLNGLGKFVDRYAPKGAPKDEEAAESDE